MKFTKWDKRTKLEKEIDEVLDVMSTLKPNSTEYSAISDNLEKLYKTKSYEKMDFTSYLSKLDKKDTYAFIPNKMFKYIYNLEKFRSSIYT